MTRARFPAIAKVAPILLAGAVYACADDSSGMDSDAGRRADAAKDASADGGGDAARADARMNAKDTWSSFAADFFDEYCVRCHNGDGRDYRTIDHVQRDAETIRCGVAPEALDGCSGSPAPAQFPVGDGPKPSDEERRRLVEWIDAGLPE